MANQSHCTGLVCYGLSILISTGGAHRRPMTYDNHPIPSHPIRHIALNELNRPKIDLSRPSMTYDELRNTKLTIVQYHPPLMQKAERWNEKWGECH